MAKTVREGYYLARRSSVPNRGNVEVCVFSPIPQYYLEEGMYITTESDLLALCEKLKPCEMLAIDTEFVREKTYFHRLGLIQVGGGGICAAIDPIAIKDLSPFLELVKNPKVLKVFHAGKQDLEILCRLTGEVIRPVFDTQVAASLVGWGAQISFAKIVQKVTGKRIHKTETYTDWCRRPLSQSQIDYALGDVKYLGPVYERLVKQLKKMNRYEWLAGEQQALESPGSYEPPDPYQQYLRVKNNRSLKPRNVAVLRELAAWRELEARRRDCLTKAIMRDEPLLEIARILPEDAKSLGAIRGFHPKEVVTSGAQILEAIQRGLAVPEDQIPVAAEVEGYSTRPGVESLLAAYVQIRSDELKTEPNVLADRKLIHDFVRYYEQGLNLDELELFQGWRRELIGKALYSIIDGQASLHVDKNGNVTLRREPD